MPQIQCPAIKTIARERKCARKIKIQQNHGIYEGMVEVLDI